MLSNRFSSLQKLVTLSLVAVATSLTGQVALAQNAAGADSLEEVVVTTARQRSEVLQNVPASITALTSATLQAASVERAGDFIRLTPGVSLVQTAEVADSQVNIRGINGARDAENSFALIIDGILQTNPAAFNREYADLKQIEIVKGPQGAIYGRNAAAGAIIITTTAPGKEFGGLAKVSYGEDATATADLVLSGPISDRASWKVAADYRNTDGFYKNSFLKNKTVDDFMGWNFNGRMLFEPSDDSKLDVKLHYGKVSAASISFNADFLLPGFTFAPLPNAQLFNENVNDHVFSFVNNIDPTNDQEAKDLSIKWDQKLSFGTLTAWALYSDIQNSLGSDGTSGAFGFFNSQRACQNTSAALVAAGGQLVPPQIIFFAAPNTPPAGIYGPYTSTACDGTQYQERNQKDYSFEVRLSSPGDQRLRWQGGLYYLNIDREVGVNTGIDTGAGIIKQLFAGPTTANPTVNLLWDQFKSDVVAGFGNIAFDVTDNLEAALALRYDREQRKADSLVPSSARITPNTIVIPNCGLAGGGTPLNPGLCPALNPNVLANGSLPQQKRDFSQLQPKVSLTWKANPNWTLYGNWGIGFKSGGFNNQGSSKTVDVFINCNAALFGPNNCGATGVGTPIQRAVFVRDFFDKEKSSAAEIGFKSFLANHRLQMDFSLFDTTVDNMQNFEFLVGGFGLLRVVNNIDKVKLKGAELGLNFRVTDDLRLIAGYSRVQSEIKANTTRPKTVGNQSPYTPSYTGTLGVELGVPVSGNGWRVDGSAFLNLVGPTWFHVVQAQQNPTLFGAPGDYTLSRRDRFSTVDARLGMSNDHWNMAIVGKNVANKKFLQEVIPAAEFGGAFIHPGAERRFSLEVGYKF